MTIWIKGLDYSELYFRMMKSLIDLTIELALIIRSRPFSYMLFSL